MSSCPPRRFSSLLFIIAVVAIPSAARTQPVPTDFPAATDEGNPFFVWERSPVGHDLFVSGDLLWLWDLEPFANDDVEGIDLASGQTRAMYEDVNLPYFQRLTGDNGFFRTTSEALFSLEQDPTIVLWSIPTTGETPDQIEVTEDRVLVAWGDSARLDCLNRADGTQLWTVPLPVDSRDIALGTGLHGTVLFVNTVGSRFYCESYETVQTVVGAIDPLGAPLWLVELPYCSRAVVGERRVAIAHASGFALIDVMTGLFIEREFPEYRVKPALELTDEYLIVAASTTSVENGVLSAFDAASGDLVWSRAQPFGWALDLQLFGDLVLVESPGGVLRAFDIVAGTPLWDWSFGQDFQLVVAENYVVVRTWDDRQVVVIDPAGQLPPTEKAIVRGRVADIYLEDCSHGDNLADIEVAVADTRTHTDGAGHYVVEIQERGTVSVWAPGSVGEEFSIELDGSGIYDAPDLYPDYCPYD